MPVLISDNNYIETTHREITMHHYPSTVLSVSGIFAIIVKLIGFLFTAPGICLFALILMAGNAEPTIPNIAVPTTSMDGEMIEIFDTFSPIVGVSLEKEQGRVIGNSTEVIFKACMTQLKSAHYENDYHLSNPPMFGSKKARIVDGHIVLTADVIYGTPNKFYTMNCLVKDERVISAYVFNKESGWAALAYGPQKRHHYVFRDGKVTGKSY